MECNGMKQSAQFQQLSLRGTKQSAETGQIASSCLLAMTVFAWQKVEF